MKTFRFMILVLLCLTLGDWGGGAWAQTSVSTDQELRSAITDGANITVTADIELSNSTLSIPASKTVTINLNNHTLDRKLTKRGEGGGQVITVRGGATLILSNGTLKGGWGRDGGGLVNEEGTVTLTNVNITGNTADDRGGGISNHGTLTMTGGSITGNTTNDQTDPKGGGGIMNTEGATATLTGVSITGNTVKVTGGGGICNYGTMTLDGCTITGNSCKMNGGGIWTAANATLNIKGIMTVTGNTANSVTNNLFLKTGAVVTITGSLEGSSVGIIMETLGVFTSGYSTYHSGTDPTTFFTSDEAQFLMMPADVKDDQTEAVRTEAGLAIHYIERTWDEPNHTVENHDRTVAGGHYTMLSSKNGDEDVVTLNEGVYVARGSVYINNIKCKGAVKLVLCDGSRLEVRNGIKVNTSDDHGSLYIYSQSYGDAMGKLRVTIKSAEEKFNGAAIGANFYKDQGLIEIHGGDIRAEGRDGSDFAEAVFPWYYSGAGIGGGYNADGGVINIYGGKIEAMGYGGEPGIGFGGIDGSGFPYKGGALTIYDGNITATGKENGPGIGSNNTDPYIGTIVIHGGRIVARGTDYGAGIGGGKDAGSPVIIITGGDIKAYGGTEAAGIGSGAESVINGYLKSNDLTITGGHVEAYGGEDGAGIGGGDAGDCGPVTITGGYVYAEGKDYGAGIGGGEDGDGGEVTITGGTVIAKAGKDATGYRAIGPGYGSSEDYGSLIIGDGLMVLSGDGTEGPYEASSRRDHCWFRTQARIEPCTHSGASYTIIDGNSHSVACAYCTTTATVQPHNFGSYGECDCHLISLADEGDNSALFTKWSDGDAHDFLLSGRKFETNSQIVNGEKVESSKAYTVCLPFDMDLSDRADDLTVWTLSYIKDGSEMVFTRILDNKVEAGKPYLVVIHKGELELIGHSPLTVKADEGVRVYDWDNREQPLGWWRGTLTKIESADAAEMMAYALQSVGDFRRIRPDTYWAWWGAFRSMYCPDELPGTNRFTINRGTLGGFGNTIVFEGDADIDDEVVGITTTNYTDYTNSDAWYTLDGRKLLDQPTKPGLYIHGNRKVLVK